MSNAVLKNLSELSDNKFTGTILLKHLVVSNITIPDYQRPYVWGKEQVEILLNDLDEQMSENSPTKTEKYHDFMKDKDEQMGENPYLLGSLILCAGKDNKGKETLEVVDGQQRLVTLALILRALEYEKNFLGECEFLHDESKRHIKENYEFIVSWFESKKGWKLGDYDTKESILEKLLIKIEFICIKAPSIDDAFIFFDSVNAKGKRLEGYDLVKAFHLRALKIQNCEDLTKTCAKGFEILASKNDEKNPPIKVLLNDILAPARIWLRDRGKLANATHSVISKHIYNEFCKEFSTTLKAKPQIYSKSLGILQGFVGGVDFFDFLAHFNNLYEKLLQSKFYENKIADIDETGFGYNRFVYIMAMLIYFDKFLNGSVDYMLRLIARAVFSLRVEKSRVGEATIKKYVKEEKILSLIYFTSTEQELESELRKFIDDRVFVEKENKENITNATKVYLERVQGFNKQELDYRETEYGSYDIVPHQISNK